MLITNYYDKSLQFITGCVSEKSIVSEDITFTEYLYFFLSSYPKIKQTYPPGVLGFSLNGKPPGDFTILQDNDEVRFFVSIKKLFNF